MQNDPATIAKGLTKARWEAMRAFPPAGQYFRATVHMRWATFNWLRVNGLVEGETQRARLTSIGLSVRAYLEASHAE